MTADYDRTLDEPYQTRIQRGYQFYWRIRSRHPERKGHLCRVITELGTRQLIVEFRDGVQVKAYDSDIRQLP
jgi:hypothetical protein